MTSQLVPSPMGAGPFPKIMFITVAGMFIPPTLLVYSFMALTSVEWDRAAKPRRKPMKRRNILAICLAAVLVFGSVSLSSGDAEAAQSRLPQQAELTNVPFFAQEDYQCGPAALAMALGWSGISIRPEALVEQVYSPARKGSLPSDMITAARRQGRVAYPVDGFDNLLREVAAGHPVIVLQDLGTSLGAYWHFAVVTGYDKVRGRIVMHSGTVAREEMTIGQFKRSWQPGDNWAIAVLPPATMPASATEEEYLEAVAGLEQAKRPQAAAEAYGAALRQWPRSLGAWMGRGNSLYAIGDLKGAADAFRRATETHPDAAPAFNNLAHVLAERGQKRAAIRAAKRAVALGGNKADTYRVTLREVGGAPEPVKTAATKQKSAVSAATIKQVIARKTDIGPFDGRWQGVAEFFEGVGCVGQVRVDMTIKDSLVSGAMRVRNNSHGNGVYKMRGSVSPTGALVNTFAGRQFVFRLVGDLDQASGRGNFRVAGLCSGIWSVKRDGGVKRTASSQSSQSTKRTTASTASARAQLVEVQSLLDQGLISAAEAAAKRRDILAAM